MSEQPTSAKLFKIVLPKDARLLNGNTICGADHDATWVLAVFAEARLSLAFFSGARQPELNPAIVANGRNFAERIVTFRRTSRVAVARQLQRPRSYRGRGDAHEVGLCQVSCACGATRSNDRRDIC